MNAVEKFKEMVQARMRLMTDKEKAEFIRGLDEGLRFFGILFGGEKHDE